MTPRQAVPFPPMLFDLDGTLVDSAYQYVLAWHGAFTGFRIDIPNWKIHRRVGMSGSFFLPPLLREIGHSASPATIKRLEKRHAKYFTRKIKTVRIIAVCGSHVKSRTVAEKCISCVEPRKPCKRQTKRLTIILYFQYYRNMPDVTPAQIARFADMFSAMGTEARLRIMQLLMTAEPKGMIVGDIQSEIDIPNSTLSHHLDKLKNENLVTVRRDGTYLWYRANTEALKDLLGFLYAECCTRNHVVAPKDLVSISR
jgi:ArsR family transcriptional regulator